MIVTFAWGVPDQPFCRDQITVDPAKPADWQAARLPTNRAQRFVRNHVSAILCCRSWVSESDRNRGKPDKA
jgi:hypothetical protein